MEALVVPAAAVSLTALAAVAAYLGAAGPRRGRRRLANVLFLAGQIAAVSFAAWTALRLGRGAAYSLVISGCGLACAAYDPVLFRALDEAEARQAEEDYARAMGEQVVAQRAHLERLKGAARDLAAVQDELVSRFSHVEGLLAAGDAPGARVALAEVAHVVPAQGASFCRNAAVDALLAYKADTCRAQGIAFDVQVQVPQAAGVPDIELCAVLSNVIDNALRAACELPAGQRWVSVRVRQLRGMLAIAVENPVRERATAQESEGWERVGTQAPEDWESREGRTEALPDGRSDVPRHGWGTSIVTTIAERHDGTFERTVDHGRCVARVVLRQDGDAARGQVRHEH